MWLKILWEYITWDGWFKKPEPFVFDLYQKNAHCGDCLKEAFAVKDFALMNKLVPKDQLQHIRHFVEIVTGDWVEMGGSYFCSLHIKPYAYMRTPYGTSISRTECFTRDAKRLL